MSICFSKGLGAPVGSAVLGSADVIARARKKRKQLGGGMRQAGLLAAGALYALEHHIERMRDDHSRARRLAEVVEGIDGLRLSHPVETNIVVFAVDPEVWTVDDFLDNLKDAGVLAVHFEPGLVRMVTHIDVSDDDIERTAAALTKLRRR